MLLIGSSSPWEMAEHDGSRRPYRRAVDSPVLDGNGPPSTDSHAMLASVVAVLHTAVWEAWAAPLQLIRLDFGASALPFMDLGEGSDRKPWLDHVCPLDRSKVREFFSSARSSEGARSIEYRLILVTGELLWVRHWVLTSWADESGRNRLQGLITAIPEQKHLEWECLRVSERERNRIGQELHDDLCQVLAGLSYLMRVLARRVTHAVPELRGEFDELNTQVVDAMERTRSMAHGLFPAQLNYATIRHALREFGVQMKTRFGLAVTLDLPRYLPPHDPEQIVHIYRITQEATSNSLKHGKATLVKISMKVARDKVELRIEDNGSGFPSMATRPEGIGMHVMTHRARGLGGALSCYNASPTGAVVHLSYPVLAAKRSVKKVALLA